MKIRCGACRTEFDVSSAGRHSCPACGAVNQVAEGAPPSPQPQPPQQAPSPLQQQPGEPVPSPAPEPAPLPKVSCPECSFEFVVGDIEVASCPNCAAEVPV